MKTRFLNQKGGKVRWQDQAGMTLVEVMIALAITGVTVAGIVRGYEYCLTQSVEDSLYMAANARAQERIEQTHSARWYVSSPQIDELVASNFQDEVVVLDLYAQSSNSVTATLQTSISDISTAPPVRRIHVDCIWQFRGTEWITNSIETCRAPDQ